MLDPYQELGVASSASLNDIKKAYRRAVMLYHPDSAKGKGNLAKFNSALNAYETLKKRFESPPQSQLRYLINRPLVELVQQAEYADSALIQKQALCAIAAKNTRESNYYLSQRLQYASLQRVCDIIEAIGHARAPQAKQLLTPMLTHSNIHVVIQSIRVLEHLNRQHREWILQQLWGTFSVMEHWKIKTGLALSAVTPGHSRRLGGILVHEQKLSPIQLQVCLLLQKRFDVLLGQLLLKLHYVSPPEVKRAIAMQQQ